MKKLGVAISTYNKIDEVATNINVIRKHWKNKDVFISVCCNDPQNLDRVKSLDIDCFTPGIDYKPSQFLQPKAWRRMRQYDTIKKAVLGCVNETEYVIQYHGDAYVLDDSVVFTMLDEMKRNNMKVAFRGKWKYENTHPKRPAGHIDDHFVIFESEHVRMTNLFSDDNEQLEAAKKGAAFWSSEGILSYLIQKVTPPSALWHYDDMRHNIVDLESYNVEDPFYPDKIPHDNIPPLNFDPNRLFLHSDTNEFTEKYFSECGVDVGLIVYPQDVE
ncbi:hypothetical protein CL614_08935 [archaeon]|nr:hypothetical protein [archaeon]